MEPGPAQPCGRLGSEEIRAGGVRRSSCRRKPASNSIFFTRRWWVVLRFYCGKADNIVSAMSQLLRFAGRNVKPTLVSKWLECTGETDDGLGCAKRKVSIV